MQLNNTYTVRGVFTDQGPEYWVSIVLTFLIQINILTPVSNVVLFIDKQGSILTAWLITWTES